MTADEISSVIIDAALKVHSALGPGLLESAYQACLSYELVKRGLAVQTELALPVEYDGILIESGYRIDILVENLVVVEVKSVEKLHAIHTAQLLSYLRLSKLTVGLLLNFNVSRMKEGIKRLVNGHPYSGD